MVQNMTQRQIPARVAVALVAAGLLAACSSDDVPQSTTVNPVVADQPLVTGAPEAKRLSGKGGTQIAILVNETAITNNDIRRRMKFVNLRRMKGNARKIATEELINEALQMQEARRINAVVSNAQVDAAYQRFEQRNKMPKGMLTTVLNRSGVTPGGFKQFIRAQMSWQRAVGARLNAEGAAAGSSKGPAYLLAADAETTQVKEYTLQQIVFTVPKAKRSSQMAARKAQAVRFRGQVNGCENTRELAAGLSNVAVLNRGRIRATTLPPNWRKSVEATPIGKPTRIQETEKGVEMLVVCRSRDVKAAKSGGDAFGGGDLQKEASELEKKYLAELKKAATIKRR